MNLVGSALAKKASQTFKFYNESAFINRKPILRLLHFSKRDGYLFTVMSYSKSLVMKVSKFTAFLAKYAPDNL